MSVEISDAAEKKRAYHRAYYQRNKQITLERARVARIERGDAVRARDRARRARANPETASAQRRARYDARTPGAAERRRFRAAGLCACGAPRIRANLCQSCETARQTARFRRDRYGVSASDLNAMWDAQGGACAVCRRTLVRRGRGCQVDHDHATGRVRGLLCGGCNNGLGFFRDDPEILERARVYLAAHAVDQDRGVLGQVKS